MTTNATVIRAGRYGEIGAILQRDATVIIDRWAKRAVQEQPTAARVHHAVLLDELPQLLAEMGRALAQAGDAGIPHRRVAIRHAEQRWDAGWSLSELVRDYRILRLVIHAYLDEMLDRPLKLVESQAVGLALDEAIESSVERFVRHRELELKDMETALRKQEAALKEADRRKNEFLATLAHELRNPLAPLRNSLDVIRLGGEVHALRERMERQVSQLSRLVDDLLDVSRIAQGKLVLRRAALDLRAVLESSVQTAQHLIDSRKHKLVIDLPEQPLYVACDQTRLIQVFVNLLNNAAKYTPEGGNLSLIAAQEEDQAAVRVKDDGTGIPPEMLSRVFEMFAQVEAGSERSQGGLGIGLTLVRRLVELHGGSIAASSPGLGQGSEFTVRLPLVAAPSMPPPTEPTECPPRHILIVEDNRDGRESLAQLLTMLGHRVDTAEDGAGGVSAALSLKPQVALIDIGLPKLNGHEVAMRLRAELGKGVMLIALTGHSQPEDRQRALEAGFDAHLAKPVELDELTRLLASFGG